MSSKSADHAHMMMGSAEPRHATQESWCWSSSTWGWIALVILILLVVFAALYYFYCHGRRKRCGSEGCEVGSRGGRRGSASGGDGGRGGDRSDRDDNHH